MKNLFISTALALMLVGMQSCQKSESTDVKDSANLDNNLKAAVSEVISANVDENLLQDLHGICMEKYDGFGDAIRINPGTFHGMSHFRIPGLSECATISVSDSVYPKEIIIDYGEACSDIRNHTISGKIIISISDKLFNLGAVKTVVSQDLFIDSIAVDLNESYKNLGINADSNWIILRTSDIVLTLEDNTVLVKSGVDTMKWVSGFGTTQKDDDIFYETGSGSISINDTLIYSRTITSPLLIDRSCEFILSGTIELYKDGNTVIVDYGDGTCDSIATVTTNGVTEEINLRSHEFGKHGKFEKHCHGYGNKGHNGNGHDGSGHKGK
jgi:hypothetical protein